MHASNPATEPQPTAQPAASSPPGAVPRQTQPDHGRPLEDRCRPSPRRWIAPVVLLASLLALGATLAAWKAGAIQRSNAAAAHQPEPAESVTVVVARPREYRRTTTQIGTVVALRSIGLRNELPGTVREVQLTPGFIVEEGAPLVKLDVSVEEAELKAQHAEAALAETLLGRLERALERRATSQIEVDRARAQLDVARAHIARIEAIIGRKVIRAPFRSRIGLSDVHPGQYLNEGTLLTTLQGVDEAAHVDFSVPQQVAGQLRQGETVEVVGARDGAPIPAVIVALDARVDPVTRNTTVRARVADASTVPPPGASVRVRVPAGPSLATVSVPANALRKGPAGDHVFVVTTDPAGNPRAQLRRVQTGAMQGDDVLVVSGLTAGESVVAHGSFKLREGALLAVGSPNLAAAASSK